MARKCKWIPVNIGGSSIKVESTRGDDLTVKFSDSDEITKPGSGLGYQLAATRASLTSRIQDGKLQIKATLRVTEYPGVTLKTDN